MNKTKEILINGTLCVMVYTVTCICAWLLVRELI